MTDILIIGAGGAGLRAALAAKEANPELKVTVMTRRNPETDSLTANACSDRMAFHVAFDHTPPGGHNAWRKHAEDIYIGGGQVSDPNLAVLLAIKAKGAFEYLDKIGVPWARTVVGKPEQFRTDGSEYPRACYTGPYTARDIHRALLEEARKLNIEFLANHRLLYMMKPDRATPNWVVFASEPSSEEAAPILAHSVILATGGPGALFDSCLYSKEADAIPFFCALLAGAKLVNLEFIQFGLVNPKTRLACSGSIFRVMPNVLNQDNDVVFPDDDIPIRGSSIAGRDFLHTLFQKGASWPVSAESDTLDIDLEIWKTTSIGGNIYLDFRENPPALDREDIPPPYTSIPFERLERNDPQVIEWFRERGVDLENEKIEIRHKAQHFQGGILINTNAETGVAGLYACGECAGGQHGANRPGGNSLMDCQVMGTIAGTNAARFASDKNHKPRFDKLSCGKFFNIANAFPEEKDSHPNEILASISKILKTEMGVVRTHDGLLSARREIDEISARDISSSGNDIYMGFATIAAIAISKAMITSAWLRNESRGSHICMESPPASNILIPRDWQFDLNWLVSSIVDDYEIQVDRIAVPELRR